MDKTIEQQVEERKAEGKALGKRLVERMRDIRKVSEQEGVTDVKYKGLNIRLDYTSGFSYHSWDYGGSDYWDIWHINAIFKKKLVLIYNTDDGALKYLPSESWLGVANEFIEKGYLQEERAIVAKQEAENLRKKQAEEKAREAKLREDFGL